MLRQIVTLALVLWGPGLAVGEAAAAGGRPKLAVMPLVGTDVDVRVLKLLDTFVTVDAGKLGAYDVIGADEIAAVIGFETMKDAAGCSDVTCAAEIGGALGADLMLAGNVAKVGTSLTVKLTLFDSRGVRVLGRAVRSVEDDDTLYATVIKALVRELFAPLGVLGAASGLGAGEDEVVSVVFSSSVSGVAVVVDGKTICSGSASACVKSLPAGEHVVSMHREGYLDRTESVRVQRGTTLSWDLEQIKPGRLAVRTEPAGAEVRVDGQAAGRAPVEQELPAGRHQVALRLPGHFPATLDVDIANARVTEVSQLLQPLPLHPLSVAGHAAFWTGLCLAGLGGFSLYAARAAGDDYNETLSLDAKSASRTWAGVMLAGFGAGAALMATGAVLWSLAPSELERLRDGGTEVSVGTDGASLFVAAQRRW